MTTQEYLEQYQAARRNAEYWQGRVEEAKARAEKTTAGIGGMPSAPNPQKLEQAVVAVYLLYKRYLMKLINKLIINGGKKYVGIYR